MRLYYSTFRYWHCTFFHEGSTIDTVKEVIYMNYVRLQNGVKMPQEGFGVFQIADAEQCEKVVKRRLSFN